MMRFVFATRPARSCRVAVFCLSLMAPFQVVVGQADTEVLSNDAVVQMVTGKLSRDLIVGKINSARPGFDLSTEGLIALNTSRVDQSIVKVMLSVADAAHRRGDAPATLVGLDEILTNDLIVRMVTSKVPKGVIAAKMQMSRSAYDVSAAGLVSLNTSKVPQDIIKTMLMPPAPPPAAKPIPVREPTPPTSGAPPAKAAPDTTAGKSKVLPAKKPPAQKTPPPPARKPPQPN